MMPFLSEVKAAFPPGQFVFGAQVDLQDQKPIGVNFKIGNGPTVTISTNLGTHFNYRKK